MVSQNRQLIIQIIQISPYYFPRTFMVITFTGALRQASEEGFEPKRLCLFPSAMNVK